MDIQHIFLALFLGHLANGLQKRLALNVAHGAADLRDDHIRVPVIHGVHPIFDLVGHMGNDLHRAAQVAPLALPVQHAPVDFSRGNGGVGIQGLVHEPLIVSQIQVRLRAVVGDKDLPVLIGAHGPWVHIEIRVKFLVLHPQPALLQQPPQGRRAYALAQARNHASGDKNVLHSTIPP